MSKLADANRCYVVKIGEAPTKVKLINFLLIGNLKFQGERWQIRNIRSGRVSLLPQRILIPGWRIRELQGLLRDATTAITLVFVHTHEQIKMELITWDDPPSYV